MPVVRVARLRETPAAEGVWMLTRGTPLGANSTVGLRPGAAPGAPTICACAAMATSRLASAVPTRTGVAPLALPVLRAVSCTTMRMPRAALKTMR
ncbi:MULTISPECIES: hypothetical protein [unclassified Variovorax]|uniref:hypothetical protein n=1 Tax=unclassified Variovorax TaxID=663243 RepID=UPI0015E0A7CB|nr:MULTISPECIES: hypothetical protein [unclassified Variovorax]